jgi:hypothetical protein
MMRYSREEVIEVRSNLRLTMRERGKIVARREGHNIWLDLGRELITHLLSYISFAPLTPARDDRVRYIGLGIGGTRQIATSVSSVPPMSTDYAGTNLQTDTDPTIQQLERPVRVSGLSGGHHLTDVWMGQIQAPPDFSPSPTPPLPTPSQVTYRRLFTYAEISYAPYLIVPLSEVGLYTNNANPNDPSSTVVAYDTFETLSKTLKFQLEVEWSIRI